MKKLVIPIVNRTNYSKLRPLIFSLSKQIDCQIVVSSAMVLRRYANAYQDILADGFPIAKKIDCLLMNDSLESMVKTLSLSLVEHASFLEGIDSAAALLSVGDRFDMLGPVLAARIMNIPVLHIQGGESSGSIDDIIRNIISACATQHYVATSHSKDVVLGLTNHPENVFCYGCPCVEHISLIKTGSYLDVSLIKKHFKYSIDIKPKEPYFLIMIHPVTNNQDDIDMKVILDSCLSFNHKSLVFYPNPDSFNYSLIEDINAYKKNSNLIFIKHAPLEDFVRFMAHSSCIIGNSSAGIREAASFGVPVVNIGERQNGRERNLNTIDVDCDKNKIKDAINKSLSIGRHPVKNIYLKENCIENITQEIVKFCK